MLSVENKAGATVWSSYTNRVNSMGRRESVTTSGDAFVGTQAAWVWRYDSYGQVIRADHASVVARDRAYEFDAIGNRVKSKAGGLELPPQPNWVSNQLNQYTTANGVALPTTPVPAPYDADGNLTAGPVPGGLSNNSGALDPVNAVMKWDAENRLREVNIGGTVVTYTYDHLSRLIVRTLGTAVRHYHYDGWNRITEHHGSTLYNTFTWGLDLSGTMQGAGGVGGLLATRHLGTTSPDHFPTYDGNGNVSEYLTVSGTRSVHYEYDPFGTLTHRTGTPNNRFEYRFSTKPRDVTSGLYYYGYRWYDPYTGRWPSRDPIEESGGVNLYGFVGNNGVNLWDLLGRKPVSWVVPIIDPWILLPVENLVIDADVKCDECSISDAQAQITGLNSLTGSIGFFDFGLGLKVTVVSQDASMVDCDDNEACQFCSDEEYGGGAAPVCKRCEYTVSVRIQEVTGTTWGAGEIFTYHGHCPCEEQ